MELKIDSDAIQDVVRAAILQELGEQGRTALIDSALKYLLTEPEGRGYGYPKPESPLQSAFNQAVSIEARKVILAELTDDEEFKAKVRGLIGEAMVKFDEQNYSSYLADAIGETLRK